MARHKNSNDKMTSITIPEKMRKFLIAKKYSNEPIYLVLNRIIVGYYHTDKADLEEELKIARESIQIWQQRALKAESQQVLFK
jgi:hypothetical protein